MFKILVVDDERAIRKGIVSILLRGLGEDIKCFEAANGNEAFSMAQEDKYNLVITDIRMPGYSGLDFVKELRKANNKVPVIVLSGHEEFGYATEAIRLGVKDYLLKPINKVEFLEIIQGYITNIEEEKQKSEQNLLKHIKTTRWMRNLKQDFLLALLKCSDSNEAEKYLNQLREMGMTLATKLYTCAVVGYEVTTENREYIDFAVKNILDEFLPLEATVGFLVNVAYEAGKVICVFEGNKQEELLLPKKKMMRKAVSLIKKYCGCRVYIGIGDIAYDSVDLHMAFQHALLAADCKIYEEADSISVYEERKSVGKAFETSKENPLLKYLRTSDDISDMPFLEEFKKLFMAKKDIDTIIVLREGYEKVQELLQQSTAMTKEELTYKTFDECWTYSELIYEVRRNLRTLRAGEQLWMKNQTLAQKIFKFVDDNVAEEIDLQIVAEKFCRTPGYIGTIFKSYTKEGFTEYLNKKRIEIAKKLLAESAVPIKEVSTLCGYSNAKYFSVVFKKNTTKTPREYRETHAR